MKKRQEYGIDFVIDKLTTSIENVVSGEIFETLVVELKSGEGKEIKKK